MYIKKPNIALKNQKSVKRKYHFFLVCN